MTGAAPSEAPQDPFTESVIDAAIEAGDEKLGYDTAVLDLRGLTDAFDAMVLTSGRTDRQVRAIAEEIEARVRRRVGVAPTHVEGLESAEWVALDYGEVVVHVFDESAREYYDLEHLWRSAPVRRHARRR